MGIKRTVLTDKLIYGQENLFQEKKKDIKGKKLKSIVDMYLNIKIFCLQQIEIKQFILMPTKNNMFFNPKLTTISQICAREPA